MFSGVKWELLPADLLAVWGPHEVADTDPKLLEHGAQPGTRGGLSKGTAPLLPGP